MINVNVAIVAVSRARSDPVTETAQEVVSGGVFLSQEHAFSRKDSDNSAL